MPHVYKPEYTREIPPGAEKCRHKGRPAVRWKGRGGKPVTGVVCKDNPHRCRVESGVWRIVYTDANGVEQDEKGYTDRAASEALLAERVRTAARIAAGLLPPEAAKPRRTLAELLDRWHRYVAANGASAEGAKRQHQRARDVCEGVGAVRPADLTPTAVLTWTAARRKENRHRLKAFGATTAANYIGSVKSFTRWLAQVEKCEPVDHLSALKKQLDPSDVRRKRRALSPKELDRLLASALASAAEVFGLTGPERHALYLLACSTGLRAIELADLYPESFTSDTVNLDVGAKNKKPVTLPVPPDVLKVVKKLFRPGEPIWPNRGKPSQAWWLRGAAMIRRDLVAAGIAATEGGRVFDFHSLRGQFATDLDRAGTSLTRAQQLMRHSTPTLTAKHYQHPEAAELAAEVAKLKRK